MNSLCMRNWYLYLSIALLLSACKTEEAIKVATISLKGNWKVILDSLQAGENARWFQNDLKGDTINLPGTLDQANLGEVNELEPALNNYVLSHLARKREYIGPAWYQKEIEIPKDWKKAKYMLELERILWESTVWVNGILAGKDNSLVTPHQFDISQQLKPGKNIITIRVDNSNLYPHINVTSDKYPGHTSGEMGHAYTNHTQIKWNGILGEMIVKKSGSDAPYNLRIDPDQENKLVQFRFKSEASGLDEVAYEITLGDKIVQKGTVGINSSENVYSGTVSLTEEVLLWDEFTPNVYHLKLITKEGSVLSSTFGFRKLNTKEATLSLNAKRIYLRGTLECAIFPLDGSPYMDKTSWKKMMQQAKAYGLNHLRFHSWCPPKAAFEAADELGFYLQAELPHWSLEVGRDSVTNEYLKKEAQRILDTYGNHPSFILMSLGNELEGEFSFLNGLVETLKETDDRRLYSTTTFSFQKGAGAVPQPQDDFFVTQWTDKGWIRGQGIFNAEAPHFNKDYSNEMNHIQLPVISHEIGQYSVYPDLSEIEKYTGTLSPLNFLAVKADLQKKGLLPLATDFTRASGNLAAILYKEEIERAMKTPDFDGFQLLQLQDFPGQGTALVGLLNAFWESKGIIDSTAFKEFCNPVTPLLRFEKAVYKSGETFEATIQIANFWQPIKNTHLRWSIKDGDQTLHLGDVKGKQLNLGNDNYLGEIKAILKVEKATQLRVELEIVGTNYKNEWKVWVYPSTVITLEDLVYTRSFKEAKSALAQGKKVLLNPDYKKLKGVDGRFVPVFWSPVHFPDQPSTMGILCNPDEPALANFPTSFHTDWQWWDLNIQSKAMILDELEVQPLVRVIDNFVTNRNLGNIFEVSVGSGSLLCTSIDLDTNLDERVVARQLKKSLVDYMKSDAFKPNKNINFEQLETHLIQDR